MGPLQIVVANQRNVCYNGLGERGIGQVPVKAFDKGGGSGLKDQSKTT